MSEVRAYRSAGPADAGGRSGFHRFLVGIVVVLALGTTVTMALLASGSPPPPTTEPAPPPLVNGTVLEVTPVVVGEAEAEAGFLPPGAVEVDLRVRLDETGEEVQVLRVLDETGQTYQPGLQVRLEPIQGEGGELVYAVVDLQRDRPLLILAALFVIAVIAFGRFQGLRALVGLALSAVVVVAFLIPAILAGRDPVVVALTSAFAIMVLTLYLAHGPSPKTTAAVVGTALTLLLTGGLALLFVQTTNLTGLASEEAQFANFAAGGLSLQGLLLAGVILGALGVLDDVTVSQASLVFELARADRRVDFSSLVRRALTVGRDHVAATVNTLFLAYAGASLPLLILFAVGANSVPDVLTSELVAIEVVRTMVGSLGLIAAVPLTTVLAAALALGEREPEVMTTLAGEREPVSSREMPVEATAAAGGYTRRLQSVGPAPEQPPPRRRSEPARLRPIPAPDVPRPEPVQRQRPPAPQRAAPAGEEPPTPRRRADRQPSAREAPVQPIRPPKPAEPRRAPTSAPQDSAEGGPARLRRTRTRQPPRTPAPAPKPAPFREKPEPRRETPPEEAESGSLSDTGRRRRRSAPPPQDPGDAPRGRRPSRPARRTAADAEAEEAENWFRQLRKPYGRGEPEE